MTHSPDNAANHYEYINRNIKNLLSDNLTSLIMNEQVISKHITTVQLLFPSDTQVTIIFLECTIYFRIHFDL